MLKGTGANAEKSAPCNACRQAAVNRLSGHYDMRCQGCRARMVARSHVTWEAKRQGLQTKAYRDLCAQQRVTHEQVKRAAA